MAQVSAGLVLYRVLADEARTPTGRAAPGGDALDEPEEPDRASRSRPQSGDDEAAPVGEAVSGGAAPEEAGPARVEVLCAHMGGPLWARKDEHAWSFPKGVIEDGEDELTAARREFAEEIGIPAPDEPYRRLGEYRYSSGKLVVLFAAEADLVVDEIRGGTFELEWPPRSGRRQEFPEIDRAAWFGLPTARTKLVAGQVPALDDLHRLLEEAT